jgi:hypothetical protein
MGALTTHDFLAASLIDSITPLGWLGLAAALIVLIAKDRSRNAHDGTPD